MTFPFFLYLGVGSLDTCFDVSSRVAPHSSCQGTPRGGKSYMVPMKSAGHVCFRGSSPCYSAHSTIPCSLQVIPRGNVLNLAWENGHIFRCCHSGAASLHEMFSWLPPTVLFEMCWTRFVDVICPCCGVSDSFCRSQSEGMFLWWLQE